MRTRRLLIVTLVSACMVAAACGQKANVHLATGANGGGVVDPNTGQLVDPNTGQAIADTGAGAAATGGSSAGGTAASGGAAGGGAAATRTGAGAAAGGAAATASGPGDHTGVTDNSIKIGVHAPVTGAAPFPNSSFDKAKDLYFKFINDKGGINGRKVSVVFQDDGYNPSQAVSVCKKMVEQDKVFMLVGGGGTDQIVACAKYAASVGVPYVAEGVTEQGLNTLGSYFALSMSYKQQGVLLAQYIKNVVQKPKVAMVRADTANFEDAHASFVSAAQQQGLTMIQDFTIPKDASATDAQTAAGKLCTDPSKRPDVVYPLMSPSIWINLAAAVRAQNCVVRWAGVGITMGLNIVATAVCGAQSVPGGASFFSPMPGLDKADATDPDYQRAYQKYNGGAGDDIGFALWGAEKLLSAQLQGAGKDLSRQSYVSATKGKTFATGVYPTVNYANSRFGGTAVHALQIDCNKQQYVTQFVNKSSF